MTTVYSLLQEKYPDVLVEDWKTLAPELRLLVDSFKLNMYIFMSIILLALTFGIINTMLMAVLERMHELGVLMAIGMNKISVFIMIMMETLAWILSGFLIEKRIKDDERVIHLFVNENGSGVVGVHNGKGKGRTLKL